MKWIKRLVFILVILVIFAVVAANFFLGDIVKSGIEQFGPKAAGVPITLEGASFRLLRGHVQLRGLVVGNPKGFNTPSSFELGEVEVKLKPASLLSDTIIVEKVYIGGPEITYERGLKDSNLSALMEQLEGEADKPGEMKPVEPAPEKGKKGGTKVIINDFLIENGKVHLSLSGLGGHSGTLPLPTIHLTDLGKDEDGASLKDIVKKVLKAIIKGATQSVSAGGEAIGKGAKAVGDAAGGAAQAVGEGAGKALKGIGGVLGVGKDKEQGEDE